MLTAEMSAGMKPIPGQAFIPEECSPDSGEILKTKIQILDIQKQIASVGAKLSALGGQERLDPPEEVGLAASPNSGVPAGMDSWRQDEAIIRSTQWIRDLEKRSKAHFAAPEAPVPVYVLPSGKDGAPVPIIADGAYSGSELDRLAEARGFVIFNTDLTGAKPDPFFAEFKLNDDGSSIISCPSGHTPISSEYKEKSGTIHAVSGKSLCEGCPSKEARDPKLKKRANEASVSVSRSKIERAAKMSGFGSEEYLKHAGLRNAIEGIPSVPMRSCRMAGCPPRPSSDAGSSWRRILLSITCRSSPRTGGRRPKARRAPEAGRKQRGLSFLIA
jgi:hypothetical protein